MKYILPFFLVPTFVFAEPVISVEDRNDPSRYNNEASYYQKHQGAEKGKPHSGKWNYV